MDANYASFPSTSSSHSNKKMLKYGVLAAAGIVCVCVGLSFALSGSNDVALAAPRGVARTRMPSRTRVNVGAGGGGSFLAPGSPFDPQRIAYMGLGAAAFHEVLRGYLLARYQKLEKLNPQRWGKPETLKRADNELNMGLTPTDIPEEIKGTPLETSYKDPFYAHSFPSLLDYLNAGLAGKNYKPKDKAPMISYWR
eukprot:CAMPEP_0185257138 /NCGR_PEP_ID=MMETSP1359-20130426/6207_1 /TAXON_ID=552665 /ORGANISM="Bigelowiella longifila, Strain CCMP242" /LENGTH=195 /DNA_ID=CAMNT_0027842077 /DNA_START=30 /DNA_END=617 /DNA_ORIENTATION=-